MMLKPMSFIRSALSLMILYQPPFLQLSHPKPATQYVGSKNNTRGMGGRHTWQILDCIRRIVPEYGQ